MIEKIQEKGFRARGQKEGCHARDAVLLNLGPRSLHVFVQIPPFEPENPESNGVKNGFSFLERSRVAANPRDVKALQVVLGKDVQKLDPSLAIAYKLPRVSLKFSFLEKPEKRGKKKEKEKDSRKKERR